MLSSPDWLRLDDAIKEIAKRGDLHVGIAQVDIDHGWPTLHIDIRLGPRETHEIVTALLADTSQAITDEMRATGRYGSDQNLDTTEAGDGD